MKYRVPFGPKRLASIHSALDELDIPAGVDSTYLAGSHSAGLDTPTSDIDLYVLVDDPSVQIGVRQFLVGEDRIDVETYSVAQAIAYVDAVLSWVATADDLSDLRRTDDEVDFVVRLLYCTPVKQSNALATLMERLEENEMVLRRLLVARWSLEAATLYEDFRGVVAQSEFISAGVAGAAIFTAASKALAASVGDLYFGRKWAAKQLGRVHSPGMPRVLLQRYLLGAWVLGETPHEEVASFVDLLQTTLSVAQLEGWNNEPEQLNWISWEGSGGLRHPLYLPIRLSDSVLLNNERRHQVQVSQGVAAIWGGGPDGRSGQIPESVLNAERQGVIRRNLADRGLFTSQPLGLPSE